MAYAKTAEGRRKNVESSRRYCLKNQDKVRAYHRRWYHLNQDKCVAYGRRYRKERGIHASAIYYMLRKLAFPMHVLRLAKEGNKKFYKKNKAYFTAKSDRRVRLMKKRRHGCIKAIAAIYRRAEVLRRHFHVHVDHIIPLHFGGKHSADNLQIIYSWENRQKGSCLNYVPSVIFS